MKKAVSYLLLLSFIIPFWGAFSVLLYQKNQHRIEIKQKIKAGLIPEELTLLTFSKADAETLLHWQHNKEFEFNGQMYDVVERGQSGDSLWFLSYWDHHETKIKRSLDRLISTSTKPIVHDRSASSLAYLQLKVSFIEEILAFEGNNDYKNILNPAYFVSNFNAEIDSPLTPPPQV